MPSSLTGLKPRDTYTYLMHMGSGAALDGTPRPVYLGGGNATPLSISSSALYINGLMAAIDSTVLHTSGNETAGGVKTFTGQIELTGQSATNGSSAVTRTMLENRTRAVLSSIKVMHIPIAAYSGYYVNGGAVGTGQGIARLYCNGVTVVGANATLSYLLRAMNPNAGLSLAVAGRGFRALIGHNGFADPQLSLNYGAVAALTSFYPLPQKGFAVQFQKSGGSVQARIAWKNDSTDGATAWETIAATPPYGRLEVMAVWTSTGIKAVVWYGLEISDFNYASPTWAKAVAVAKPVWNSGGMNVVLYNPAVSNAIYAYDVIELDELINYTEI